MAKTETPPLPWVSTVGPALSPPCSTSAHQAAYHRWPAEKWILLLKRFNEEGIRSVVLWGPDEKEFSEEIAKLEKK